MDPAVLQALQSRLAALANCLAKGADMWDRWRLSGDVLDVFRWGLVPEIPALQEAWEAAKKVHYVAMVDIFGADSADVLAAFHQTLSFCFPSVVFSCCRHYAPACPSLLLPQPAAAAMPQPAAAAAMAHPAAAVLPQPAAAVLPQPAAAVLPQPAPAMIQPAQAMIQPVPAMTKPVPVMTKPVPAMTQPAVPPVLAPALRAPPSHPDLGMSGSHSSRGGLWSSPRGGRVGSSRSLPSPVGTRAGSPLPSPVGAVKFPGSLIAIAKSSLYLSCP